MQELCLRRVRRAVIYLLAVSAACYKSPCFELPEMMGYGRTAHFHHGRQIDHAFFTVAQDPEYTDPAGIAQLFENIGNYLKFFRLRHMLKIMFHALPVVMRQ